MNNVAAAEAVGGRPITPDDAYVAMLNGDPSRLAAVDPYFQQVILAATNPKQRAPREADIADAVWSGITLPETHMLAEMLEGRASRPYKIAQGTARGIGALTIIPEIVFGVGTSLAGAAHPVAGKVVGGVAQGFSGLRLSGEALARRGMGRVEGAAHALIRHRYAAHYHTAPDLAPYVWASLLANLARRGDVRPEAMGGLALRFRQSFEHSMGGRSPEHMPPPLRAMYAYLRDGFPAADAIDIFRQREAEARQERAARQAALFAPRRTTQPRGAALESLRESSEEYQFFVTHPYYALEARMRRVAQEVNSNEPGSLQEMAAVMSAVIERAQLGDDPDRPAFIKLLADHREKYGDLLRDMVVDSLPQLTNGTAPLGIVRLADSFVRQPSLWEGWTYEEDGISLYRALEAAAFKWYEQPIAAYSHNPPIRRMLYAAYINRRTLLGGGTRDLALAKQRAWALLRVLPNRRGPRDNVERSLPVVVRAELATARQVIKTKAKKAPA